MGRFGPFGQFGPFDPLVQMVHLDAYRIQGLFRYVALEKSLNPMRGLGKVLECVTRPNGPIGPNGSNGPNGPNGPNLPTYLPNYVWNGDSLANDAFSIRMELFVFPTIPMDSETQSESIRITSNAISSIPIEKASLAKLSPFHT